MPLSKPLQGQYLTLSSPLVNPDLKKKSPFFLVSVSDSISKKEGLRLLKAIKNQRPKSLYDLAKKLNRDLKNVQTDAKYLAANNLIELDEYKVGKKRILRPVTYLENIILEMRL